MLKCYVLQDTGTLKSSCIASDRAYKYEELELTRSPYWSWNTLIFLRFRLADFNEERDRGSL